MSKKRKGRKLKKKKIILFSFILILIICAISFVIPKNYGYNKEATKAFKEMNIYDKIKDKKVYSKVLEEAVLNGTFNEKYLDSYLDIKYIDGKTNVKDINNLLSIGYSSSDINTFYEKIPNSINVIIDNDYDKEIANYLKLKYFKEDNLDRYIKYENNTDRLSSVYDTGTIETDYNYEDTVTFVNAYLDKKYYSNDIDVSNEEAEKIDVVVNKYYKLDKNYEPSDLTKINSKFASGDNQRLRKEAAVKFEEMATEALNNSYKIYAGSTYRSYEYQLGLYNRYVRKDGFDAAETYSARAGYSEHQLGLAVDVINGKWEYLSEDDKEYDWLTKNSYKYGFILRYPRGKEYITGYMFEDWHFRYLGIDLATKVYNSGLTYDEYVARGL